MKDMMIKGTGNSRYLKSNIPADTSLSQLIAMLNAGTFPFDFNGVNASGITQEGDALNKANLLQDATCTLLGLPTTAVPDDAFEANAANIGRLVMLPIRTSQIWTAPKAVSQKFRVFAVGGGGSAGIGFASKNDSTGVYTCNNTGSGGGGGGYVEYGEFEIAKGTNVIVTVGAAGATVPSVTSTSVTNKDGNDGGATSFGSYLSAAGGKRGYYYACLSTSIPSTGSGSGNGGDGGAGGGGAWGQSGGQYYRNSAGGDGGKGGKGGNGGKYGGGGGGGGGEGGNSMSSYANGGTGSGGKGGNGGNGGEYGGAGGGGGGYYGTIYRNGSYIYDTSINGGTAGSGGVGGANGGKGGNGGTSAQPANGQITGSYPSAGTAGKVPPALPLSEMLYKPLLREFVEGTYNAFDNASGGTVVTSSYGNGGGGGGGYGGEGGGGGTGEAGINNGGGGGGGYGGAGALGRSHGGGGGNYGGSASGAGGAGFFTDTPGHNGGGFMGSRDGGVLIIYYAAD